MPYMEAAFEELSWMTETMVRIAAQLALAVRAKRFSAARCTWPRRRRLRADATRLAGELAALAALVMIAMPSFASGQWWGSPRTPGFDQNTVIRVAGTISQVQLTPRSGPSTLRLQAGTEAFTVALGPQWYLAELHADLREGDRVLVEGSKMMDSSGNLHIMAARVTSERSGKILELRDERGQPRWVRGLGVPAR